MKHALALTLAVGGAALAQTARPVELRAIIGNWLDPNSPTTDATVRALMARFQRENPGIKVNWDPQGYNELEQKLLTATAASNPPDFAYVDSIWVQRLASLGALQPLDTLWSAKDRADYKPPFLEGAKYDGKLYAVWSETDTRVLWYNTELFKKAGLDPNRPPRTWAEFLSDARKLTGNGVYGVGIAYGPHEYLTADLFLTQFWGLGGKLLDAQGRPVFHQGSNRAAAIKTLEFFGDLQKNKVIPPDALQLKGGDSLYAGMASGRYAMVIGNNNAVEGGLKPIAPTTYGQWKAAVLPAPTGGKPSSMNGGFTWAIFTKDPAKQQAAWKFISFWNSPAVQLERYKPTAQVPVRFSTSKDKFYTSAFWQTVNQAVTAGQTRPGVALYPVMSDQIQQAMQAYLTGQKSAAQAIDDAGQAVTAEYARQQTR